MAEVAEEAAGGAVETFAVGHKETKQEMFNLNFVLYVFLCRW